MSPGASVKDYKGVKGWLLLFCVCLTLLDPLAAILNLALVVNAVKPGFEKTPGLFHMMTIGGACTIGLVVFGIYAGLSLWKVVPGAVNTGKKYLSAVLYYSLFSIILPYMVGLPEEMKKQFVEANLINGLRTVAYISCWYLYLIRSKRVKATYYPAERSVDISPDQGSASS